MMGITTKPSKRLRIPTIRSILRCQMIIRSFRLLREAKAEALVAHLCARVGRKDVVGEVKGIEMMGVLGAGRGARERGGRRLEVEVNSKR